MISVTLLSKNSERHLEKVLISLKDFDEVLLYDNGSADKTLEIAASFPNVRIKQGSFIGFGPTHNVASSCAKNDWILSIDTDEVVSDELKKEIFSLTLNRGTIYEISRENRYRGKVVKGCGWSPDRVLRLYHRGDTKFTDALVHERVLSDGLKTVRLKGVISHFSYDSLSDFLKKMQHYSDLFSDERKGKVSSSPLKALSHGSFAFFKSYILKGGILEGYNGFIISIYNGHTAFYKYLKLYEKNQLVHTQK